MAMRLINYPEGMDLVDDYDEIIARNLNGKEEVY